MTQALAISDAQWGLIGTSAVAIVGLLGQILAGSRERRSQRELRQLEREYEDKVRRRSLLYERREGVYVDLLAHLQRADRQLRKADLLSEIQVSSVEENIDLRARVGAVGSTEVTEMFDRWRELNDAVAAVVGVARARPSKDNNWDHVVRLREQMTAVVSSMEAQINEELDDI